MSTPSDSESTGTEITREIETTPAPDGAPKMLVEIWSDIACPWCYIGKRRFEQALADFPHRDALDVVWRSFELDADAPKTAGLPTVELLAVKYRIPVEKAQAMMDSMTATGAADGITFRFDISISGNTFDAHRLIHFADTRGKRTEMVERLFAAYFTEGLALANHETLVRLAADVGLDAEEATIALSTDGYSKDVRADERRATELGITGVPFFAIDERYGISGAQPASALVEALSQAYFEFTDTQS
ncbi:MAG TPA: DsbA family oxidoreductase [Gemmatimonadaceae bacterium]|nr:DsbA family oxidoreductase [Gemmatimonadaceae bacterium]